MKSVKFLIFTFLIFNLNILFGNTFPEIDSLSIKYINEYRSFYNVKDINISFKYKKFSDDNNIKTFTKKKQGHWTNFDCNQNTLSTFDDNGKLISSYYNEDSLILFTNTIFKKDFKVLSDNEKAIIIFLYACDKSPPHKNILLCSETKYGYNSFNLINIRKFDPLIGTTKDVNRWAITCIVTYSCGI